jgi:hypothetical protein
MPTSHAYTFKFGFRSFRFARSQSSRACYRGRGQEARIEPEGGGADRVRQQSIARQLQEDQGRAQVRRSHSEKPAGKSHQGRIESNVCQVNNQT